MSLVSVYNNHRYARSVLKKFRKTTASLTVELHGDYWRFHGQEERLAYDGPSRPFLEAIRTQTIPSSIFASLLDLGNENFPIYDGCIIIEILDFRIPPKPSTLPLNGLIGSGTITPSNAEAGPSTVGLPYPNVTFGGTLQPKPPQSQNAFTAVAVAMAQAVHGKLGESHSSRNAFKRGRESSLHGGSDGNGTSIGDDGRKGSATNGERRTSLAHRPSIGYPGLDDQPRHSSSNIPLAHSNAPLNPFEIHANGGIPLRPPTNEPKELPLESVLRYRTLMRPDGASLWEQMVHMNGKQKKGDEWDDIAVLHLEARVLAATAPNLCLDPTTILPTRTANLSMNLTYPMPTYISYDGSYIPRSERPQSSLIIPSGPGLDSGFAVTMAAVSTEAIKVTQSVNGMSRTASSAKDKQVARETWSSELGLRKEDLDALAVGHDPAKPISKQHLFDMSSRVAKYWSENSDWRRPDQSYSNGMDNAISGSRSNGGTQCLPVDFVGAISHRTPGYEITDGPGNLAEGLDVMAARSKKSKKKKKEQTADGIKQDESVDVDMSMDVTFDATVPFPTTADGALEEKSKPKKKSKKERALERAAREEAAAAEPAESPPASGITIKAGKKRPVEEVAESPLLTTSAAADITTASTDRPKKMTKKQREQMVTKQQEVEEPVLILEPPKKKAKKANKAKLSEGDVGVDANTTLLGEDPLLQSSLPESGEQQGMHDNVMGVPGMVLPEIAPAYQPHPDMQQAAYMAAQRYQLGNGMRFGNNGIGMPPMELPIQVQPNQAPPQVMPDQSQFLDVNALHQFQQQLQQVQAYQMLNLSGARHPGQSRAPGGA